MGDPCYRKCSGTRLLRWHGVASIFVWFSFHHWLRLARRNVQCHAGGWPKCQDRRLAPVLCTQFRWPEQRALLLLLSFVVVVPVARIERVCQNQGCQTVLGK